MRVNDHSLSKPLGSTTKRSSRSVTLFMATWDERGASGTVLAYTDWDARYDELLEPDGRVPESWRPHVPPFDAAASRAAREHGALPEFPRTCPGARRSGNPGVSVAALGPAPTGSPPTIPWTTATARARPLAKLVARC